MHFSTTGLRSAAAVKQSGDVSLPTTSSSQQETFKWAWPTAAGATSTFAWERSAGGCVKTPGQSKSLRCCVKTWAAGTQSQVSWSHLRRRGWSSRACTSGRAQPTCIRAASSNTMKQTSPVTETQHMLFAQVTGCWSHIQIFKYFGHLKCLIVPFHLTMRFISLLSNCSSLNLVFMYNINNKFLFFAAGSVKTRINASRYKCFGHVEAYLGGQWLPVCSGALKDSETRNTICSEMGCGQTGEMVDDFGPKSTRDHVISQMQCSTDGKRSLAACSIISTAATCALGVLRCSGMCHDFDSYLSLLKFLHHPFTLSPVT